jgi:hypothetical protein
MVELGDEGKGWFTGMPMKVPSGLLFSCHFLCFTQDTKNVA